MLVSSDDQVKAYIKKIMTQLNEWMIGGKISKLVVVITSKDTGEHVERWQFDARLLPKVHHQAANCIFAGTNILQIILEEILVQESHQQGKRRPGRQPAATGGEDRGGDPSRDSVHL